MSEAIWIQKVGKLRLFEIFEIDDAGFEPDPWKNGFSTKKIIFWIFSLLREVSQRNKTFKFFGFLVFLSVDSAGKVSSLLFI